MKGWILFDERASSVVAEDFEVQRLIDVGPNFGLQMTCVHSDYFDLVVDREGRDSIILNNELCELPDFLLPRKGAGLRATACPRQIATAPTSCRSSRHG